MTKLTLDGYAAGRRIRLTLASGRVTLVDRGTGLPEHQAEKTDRDDALEVRVLPATLEDVRTKLLGERGLVTRGQRFEAEFEELTLAVEDAGPLVDLLRAVLAARPRSELELDGTLENLPFKVKLAKDREGRARLTLDGFVFVDADGRSPESTEIGSPPTTSENVPPPMGPSGRRGACWDRRTSS
jgi:hypothetical protein